MTTLIKSINQAATVLAENDIKLVTFDHNIGYDYDLSQMYYDEFIANASGCHEVQKFDSYLVVYGSDISPNDKHYKVSHLRAMRKDVLVELCYDFELNVSDHDLKSEIIDQLMTLDHEDYYKRHHANSGYYDLDYSYTITGYSKGDVTKVKTVGKVESWITEDYLTNLFYDAPITGSIEIEVNGDLLEEIKLYDFIEDEYASYDKDTFIKNIDKFVKDDCFYKVMLLEYLNTELATYL